jgi:hypothetical protein
MCVSCTLTSTYSARLGLSLFPCGVHISCSQWLRSGKQAVVSIVNVLAPYFFGSEFELAIGMYTWQRVWVGRIYNVVSTSLESLCILSAGVRVLHSTSRNSRCDTLSMGNETQSWLPCFLMALHPSSAIGLAAVDLPLMASSVATYDFRSDRRPMVLFEL